MGIWGVSPLQNVVPGKEGEKKDPHGADAPAAREWFVYCAFLWRNVWYITYVKYQTCCIHTGWIMKFPDNWR